MPHLSFRNNRLETTLLLTKDPRAFWFDMIHMYTNSNGNLWHFGMKVECIMKEHDVQKTNPFGIQFPQTLDPSRICILDSQYVLHLLQSDLFVQK